MSSCNVAILRSERFDPLASVAEFAQRRGRGGSAARWQRHAGIGPVTSLLSSRCWGLAAGILLSAALSADSVAGQEREIRLLGGSPAGIYQALATSIQQESRQQDLPFQLAIRESAGAVDSLRQMLNRDGDEILFAFAQQDAVVDFLNQHGETAGDLRVVGRVFYEYLHILRRSGFHIDSVRDFAGMRIWAGRENSGTRLTSQRFFDSVGLSPTQLKILPESAMFASGSTVSTLLQNRAIDLATVVAAVGSPSICEGMQMGAFELFPIDHETLRTLATERDLRTDRVSKMSEAKAAPSGYRHQIVMSKIPPGSYPGLLEPVPTIAIPVLLLTTADPESERDTVIVRWMQSAAAAEWQMLTTREGSTCRLVTPNVSAPPVSLSGLPPYFENDEPEFRPTHWARWPAIALALLVPGLLLWQRRARWYRKIREEALIVGATLLFVGSIFLITGITYYFEHEYNENFETLIESFWSITIYLFSGLEDRNPYTTTGKIVAAFGLILGPAFFAIATGWLAKTLMHWERKMPQHLEGHYLILNWSPRAVALVKELHHPVINRREGVSVIVVLTDDDNLTIRQLKEEGSGKDEAFEDFYISVGDPTQEGALRNANAHDAKTILILAGERDESHADERTIRSIIMLRRIAHAQNIDRLHVVAELRNAANEQVVEEIAKDFPGSLEAISGLQVRTCLMAQAVLNEGVVDFYTDLLRVTGDTNEVYVRPLPESAVGMRFRDYCASLLQQDSDEPWIPVGVQRRVHGRLRIFSNPRIGSPGSILQADDGLVLLAYEPPDCDMLPTLPRAVDSSV